MAIQNYTDSPYFFTMSVSAPGQTGPATILEGLADLTIEWRKPVRYYKNLDDAYPQLVYGKAEGRIILRGFATSSEVSGVFQTSDTMFQGTLPAEYASTVTINVLSKAHPTATEYTSTYAAYSVGQGFGFRRVEERRWVMDGIKIFEIFD